MVQLYVLFVIKKKKKKIAVNGYHNFKKKLYFSTFVISFFNKINIL